MNEQTENKADEQNENLAAETAETLEAEEVVTEPTEELDELSKAYVELADMKDKYMRLYADFENFRRRTAKERVELIQTAGEGVLKEILPLVDDFERANKSFETVTEIEPIKEGISLIFNKLEKFLTQQKVQKIEAQGAAFDADFHECITQFPAPTEDLKNKVIDVVENGYTLGEKVIRYAKVVVGN
jgi:molecular chaperone GrpE